MSQIDYAKLARQHGGSAVEEAPPVDYSVMARQSGGTEQTTRHPHAQMAEVAKGAIKGVAGMAFGVGKALHDYTPIGRLTDVVAPGVFDERPTILEATNTPQRIGKTAAEIGSFFMPVGGTTRLAKTALETAKAAGLTLAQTDSPLTAGISAGLTAIVPAAGAVIRAGQRLKQGAEKTIVQALAPTKEVMKSEAAKLAPEMLRRGVGGSRAAMLERATGEVEALGPQIDAAVQAAAAQGTTVAGQMVIGAIQKAKQALTTPNAVGAAVPIEGTQSALKTLNRLEDFVDSLGPDIPIDQANRIKQAWQKIVSKAGFYGPKATASATDNAKAWATREAEKAMRGQIALESPSLAALNKEYSFWKGLQDVLEETTERTQSHTGGLVANVTGGAGVIGGLVSGESAGDKIEKMLTYGVAGRQVIRLLQSPLWKTRISAPLKNKLADALLSGKTKQVQDASRIVVTSLPARLRPAPIGDMSPVFVQESPEESRPRGARPQ